MARAAHRAFRVRRSSNALPDPTTSHPPLHAEDHGACRANYAQRLPRTEQTAGLACQPPPRPRGRRDARRGRRGLNPQDERWLHAGFSRPRAIRSLASGYQGSVAAHRSCLRQRHCGIRAARWRRSRRRRHQPRASLGLHGGSARGRAFLGLDPAARVGPSRVLQLVAALPSAGRGPMARRRHCCRASSATPTARPGSRPRPPVRRTPSFCGHRRCVPSQQGLGSTA